jgi:hypothetical protein
MTTTQMTTTDAEHGILRQGTMRQIRGMWMAAHADGRAVLTHSEVVAKLTAYGVRRADLDFAVARGLVRKGVTGYWLPEAPDPGAIAVFQRALRAPDVDADEA